MRPSILLLVALALLAVGIWLAYGWFEDPDLGPGTENAGTARAADEHQQQRGTAGIAKDSDHRKEIENPQTRPGPEKTPVNETGDALTVVVRVVIAKTDEPVPGASVSVMSQQFDWVSMSDQDRQTVHRYGRDNVGLFEHFGKVHGTDENGELHLPIKKHLFLACEHDGHYGELYLDAAKIGEERRHVLRLLPDRTLRVRVVDAGGQPLPEFPLGLRLLWKPDATGKQRTSRSWAQIMTNKDGLATLKHLQDWVQIHAKNGRPDRMEIGLRIPGVTEFALKLDPMAPPEEIVELTAPATGQVLLRLRDAEGSPLGSYEDLRLRFPDNDKLPAAERLAWGGVAKGPGQALFRYVALGHQFEASATVAEDVDGKTFAGPSRQGEKIEVALQARSGGTVLTGRLFDVNNKPLGRMHLQLHFEGKGTGGAWRLTSQADGRFRAELDEGMVGTTLTRAVLQQVARFEGTSLMAEVHPPTPLLRGRNDLGNVIMREAPLIASGKVLVDSAPPAQRVNLSVEFMDEDGDWRQLHSSGVSFPKPGVFEIRGIAMPGRHRLVPDARDCLPPPKLLEFQQGQRDLLIELYRGGSLRTQILMDDPSMVDALVFTLTAHNPTPASQRALQWRSRSEGGELRRYTDGRLPEITWRGLVAGDYRLTLRSFGATQPIVDLRNLAVPNAQACKDKRLQPIDLRNKLRKISVRVTYAASQSNNLQAAIWSGKGQQPIATWTRSHAVLMVAGPVDLWVAAQGYRIARLDDVSKDTTVELQPLPTIPVSSPAVTVPKDAKLLLRVTSTGLPVDRLEPRSGTDKLYFRRFVSAGNRLFGVARPRTVQVPVRPGEDIQLKVFLQYRSNWFPVSGTHPEQVTPDLKGNTPIELKIPQAAVEKAWQKARR